MSISVASSSPEDPWTQAAGDSCMACERLVSGMEPGLKKGGSLWGNCLAVPDGSPGCAAPLGGKAPPPAPAR